MHGIAGRSSQTRHGPGQVASGIWCKPCSEFTMEVVMRADWAFALIAPQSERSPG